LIDSHCHLNRDDFGADRAAVFGRAREAGVRGFLNVGYDPESSAASLALAHREPDVWATVGVHPHDAELLADADGKLTAQGEAVLAEMQTMAADERVVAIGEIGLDFFRDLSPRPAQRAALGAQLDLARRLDLPVVFHVRDAWRETLEFIDAHGAPPAGGVLHAFSGDAEAVEWARRRGFLLGIGGPVTYKNSALPERVAAAGSGMLLLETDAPWLPPVPHRGQRNEPAHVAHTCAKVAEILQMPAEEVAAATTASFHRLFRRTGEGA
jgi:TatD DNase family protein